MGPDEVIEKLQNLGLSISKRSLQDYAKKGLIPRPKTKALGRGQGSISEYDNSAPDEYYSSWKLMHGLKLSPKQVSHIRRIMIIWSENVKAHLKKHYNFDVDSSSFVGPKINAISVEEIYNIYIQILRKVTKAYFKEYDDVKQIFEDEEQALTLGLIWWQGLEDEIGKQFLDEVIKVYSKKQ